MTDTKNARICLRCALLCSRLLLARVFLPVCIPEDIRVHEALILGKPVVCHDIASPGASAFLELANLWAGMKPIAAGDKEESRP